MRAALWPTRTVADMDACLARWDTLMLVADFGGGMLHGFAQVSERAVVEGCSSSPVAYIEGWWVDPAQRHLSVHTTLVSTAETWASQHGYREMATGADATDDGALHERRDLGFAAVARIVVLHKLLASRSGPNHASIR